MAKKITLKQIGGTLNSIGKATIRPAIKDVTNITQAPFKAMVQASNGITSSPFFYIMIAGVAIVVLNKYG